MKDTMIRQGSSSDSSIAPVKRFELVCPAGSLPALKVAIDSGADCVYLGFRDETNARNFAGLNFDDAAIEQGVRFAHARGARYWWHSILIRSRDPAIAGANRSIALRAPASMRLSWPIQA